jgi:hypothetical protein
MASSINASTAGVGGIITTADNTGILNIQSGGTTVAAVTSTGVALTGTLSTTGNVTLGDASTDTLNVGNGGLVKDASGNVGVGVTPSAWRSTQPTIQVGTASFGAYNNILANFGQNMYVDSSNVERYITSTWASQYYQYLGAHTWRTAPIGTAGNAITFTQAMTLDASGALYLGSGSTPISSRYNAISLTAGGCQMRFPTNGWLMGVNATSGNNINFYTDNGTNFVAAGIISSNGSSTTYGTSSDYRMKENIAPMTGALEKIALLKPVTYIWKSEFAGTNINGQGFIAHELAEVVPDCVTGEKDGTREEEYQISPAIPAVLDEEGNEITPAVEAVMGTRTVPVYQGIDTSFLVATLTAAIQEQQAMIDELKAEIDLLKGVK